MIREIRSVDLFRQAQDCLVGGVNSPVRSFRNVGMDPIYFHRSTGPWIISVEGRKFIDYVLAWGTFILGHGDEDVKKEIINQLELGIHFGSCHELEIEFATLIKKAFKCIDKIRVSNSGTEAVTIAIRLARGFTNRKKILKFAGNYHGHVDYLLVRAGSGLATLNIPSSKGIPQEFVNETIVVEYNDARAVEEVFEKYGTQIAGVIVEPVAGNIGVIPPQNGFLRLLREITRTYGSVLIFDEVITGFRSEFGGISNLYDPDLVILGKIVGGGLPIGVIGGKKEIMDLLTPVGEVYHAGTFNGNLLVLAAGVATLKKLMKMDYRYLEELGQIFEEGIVAIKNRFNQHRIKLNRYGPMISIFFNDQEVVNSRIAYESDRSLFAKMYRFLIEKGIYFPPSPFEAIFISFAHTINEISYTIDRIEEFFVKM
ncbi:MAG: glutamate-1-semialdehyde 2,1-aminomutase [Candidatus Calescibacterium sp.]|nr:glutamate-1-semialdehyde 2,1-aminomutase [Candidatus Calescibacterium sp.]